ncbi:hypothetical protein H7H78_13230 [Mycobacterium shinjukuense]|uniref:Anti-sigma-M factor RsmA n=1 Tax=Mycobacterium shinjukuense TaxID=398694 RepID=A0A7I7MUQ3_9MYCO|nr:hypothetical protein [Mycobacterium shinjukuense]MCV6986359.1 hypothetical protein [Mycobacterium shinjukuense]ORB67215.1 hypothetical protein BST45_12985 [Mycobacterium shinjukuense]BBX75612.1 anti-sigma-M factor RsmA [Mycobacterium shinjukuense]
MGAAENRADGGPPLTVELLAELQAGLLDDEAAARVRRQIRADPEAAGMLRALHQVRRDVAAVGADPTSAPEVPADVTAGVLAALRSAAPGRSPSAAHAVRPRPRVLRVIAGVAGLSAAAAAIGLGTTALLHAPPPAPTAPPTAQHITVSTPAPAIPLSQADILALLDRAPDYGPLADPSRRASCLSGLGYPASTRVLGARPIEINARPGVLLVVPGDAPDSVTVFAVAPNCSAADTGLLASTTVARS